MITLHYISNKIPVLIRVHLSLPTSEHNVKVVKHWNHGERAQEHQHGAKDPKQQRECCIE